LRHCAIAPFGGCAVFTVAPAAVAPSATVVRRRRQQPPSAAAVCPETPLHISRAFPEQPSFHHILSASLQQATPAIPHRTEPMTITIEYCTM
jgi:hypothetical protein